MSSSAMNMPTAMVAKAKIFWSASGFVARRARPRPRRRSWLRLSRSRSIDRGGDRQARAAAGRARTRPPSSTMRTGTRCTILVKLPVAFSGGSTLNCAPVAGARLTTWPWKTSPGSTSAVIVTGCPALHAGELVFLEIGIHPQAVRRHDGEQLRADRGDRRRAARCGCRRRRRRARAARCSRD